MKASVFPSAFDHYLVAKVQARATGATAHDVHQLLSCYFGLCDLAEVDPECAEQLQVVEQRLRAFCHTGSLARVHSAPCQPCGVTGVASADN